MAGKKNKKSSDNINSKLQLVTKSGKYTLGYKSVLRAIRNGDAKLVLLANNTPPLIRCELEYYAWMGRTSVKHYNGNSISLATACGKYFQTTALAILDAGDSDILRAQ
eukprot:TRINITY_DN80_c0_g2_i1.p3 TRINITY_DN80_c0_g2~~TRINITY_DN80_c0_g2_i1.p3  ORF type:complete len:108 (-),score=23.44 TRINITY_DN80_c0_g2_i1:368-691(-)